MSMKVYTIRDFRNNMKEALDLATLGEDVFIDRLSNMFQVIPVKTKRDYADVPKTPSVPTLPGQMTVDEAISIMETTAPAEEWKVAGRGEDSGERLCCSKTPPCKHWIWDGILQAHQNSLSGRIVTTPGWGA